MSHYQNADPASERLVQAVKAQLETITEANGYWITVGEVHTDVPQRANTTRWPIIEVLTGREETLNKDISDEALDKNLYLRLLCYHAPDSLTAEDVRIFQQRMKADVEYLFGNNWALKNSDDVPLCRLAMVTGGEPFKRLDKQNYAGVAVDVRVRYSQDIYDPSKLV